MSTGPSPGEEAPLTRAFGAPTLEEEKGDFRAICTGMQSADPDQREDLAWTLHTELSLASPELLDDEELILFVVSSATSKQRAAKELVSRALARASEQLRADRKLVLAAVSNGGLALEHASQELKGDKEVVLAAVSNNGLALEHASQEIKQDKEVVLAAVSNDGRALEHASQEFKRDKEVVLAAVSNDGLALGSASEQLRGDKEVVVAAVRNGFFAIPHAKQELWVDEDIMLLVMNQSGTALQSADPNRYRILGQRVLDFEVQYGDRGFPLAFASEDFRGTKAFVLAALQVNPNTLEYASEQLRADEEVVLTAVSKAGRALAHASEGLRGNKEVVLAAVKHNGDALEYASEQLRADEEVVLAAAGSPVFCYPAYFRHASAELRNNKDVVLLVARHTSTRFHSHLYREAGEEVRNAISLENFLLAAESSLAITGQSETSPAASVELSRRSRDAAVDDDGGIGVGVDVGVGIGVRDVFRARATLLSGGEIACDVVPAAATRGEPILDDLAKQLLKELQLKTDVLHSRVFITFLKSDGDAGTVVSPWDHARPLSHFLCSEL